MAKFELEEVKGLDGKPITIGDKLTGEVLEFDPDSDTKYIFTFDMGNLPGDIIAKQLEKWAAMLRDLLGPNRCLICAKTQSEHQPIQENALRATEDE